AAKIAQDSIGIPSSYGDSTVTIAIKKPIDTKIEKVDLSSAPEMLKIYGSKLFGLNLDKPFQLQIHISNLLNRGDVTVTKVAFSEPPKEGSRALVDVDLEIRRVSVSSREIWVREVGLTPPVNGNESTGCKVARSRIAAFSKDRIAARVLDARVVPRSAEIGERPIHAHGKFEVTYEDHEMKLRVLSMTHDIEKTLNPNYVLKAKLEVPPVIIKIGNDCYIGDDSGIKVIFNSMLDGIKMKLVSSLGKTITNIAMKSTRDALAKLVIPVDREFAKPESFVFLPDLDRSIVADKTRVARALPQKRFQLSASEIRDQEIDELVDELSDAYGADQLSDIVEEVAAEPARKPNLVDRVLWHIQERLSLGALSGGDDGLRLDLVDQLTLNRKSEMTVLPNNEGRFPEQRPTDLRVILNHSFFTSKVDLVESMRAEQSRLLPAGLRISDAGISLKARKDNQLRVGTTLEIDLRKVPQLDSFQGLVLPIARVLTGNSAGIYQIPLELGVSPRILKSDSSPTSRKLVIGLSVSKDQILSAVVRAANVPYGSKIIPMFIEEKLKAFTENLANHPPSFELDVIEKKSPLRLERVVFSDLGSLAVDFSLQDNHLRKDAKRNSISPEVRL
ncbi:MAG: hypothetical protein H7301_14385, partial [Cryobacterium sp.]|nr:hypothetical protein [Oligoflexia bacterium]